MINKIANFAGFQLNWFANVLGAAGAMVWLGPLVTLVLLAIHLAISAPRSRSVDLALLAIAAVSGYLLDSVLVLSGLMSFADSAQFGGPSPVWMVCLWIGFAATLRHSLGWLRGRPLMAALLGAAGGPLAYYAGGQLGAVSFPDPGTSLTAVALVWLVMTPALLVLAQWLENNLPSADGKVAKGTLT